MDLQSTKSDEPYRLDFRNRVIVLTGGSRGIGFGIAQAFCQANAALHIIAIDPELPGVVQKLSGDRQGGVTGHYCDITDGKEVDRCLAEIGHIDVFIANAGLERMTPIDDASVETEAAFRRIIDVNVIGTYLCIRAALRNMRAGGSIILTSSVWGKSAVGAFGAYVASKHANIGFMRGLARELGPKGIRVNCVCPGWVRTDSAMQSLSRMSARSNRAEAAILDDVIAAQCLPGLQDPADVADLYLFLASSLSRNITGQAINIDRGEFLG
ncbi:MAG: SDR family NAD(P)-dependent oxidoreductase [Parvibaculaceae bacterium]